MHVTHRYMPAMAENPNNIQKLHTSCFLSFLSKNMAPRLFWNSAVVFVLPPLFGGCSVLLKQQPADSLQQFICKEIFFVFIISSSQKEEKQINKQNLIKKTQNSLLFFFSPKFPNNSLKINLQKHFLF